MKIIPLKNLLQSKPSLFIISLFFGYSFWYIASINHIITSTIIVPLCFNIPDNYDIIAPEKIALTLKGKRIDLYNLDMHSLAAHITIDKLSDEKHGIIIKEKDLFLPHTISIAHYKPSNIMVTITKKELL